MTDITAKIIADSVSPQGKRLTTIQMRYPRFIHAENKTHRMLTEHGILDEDGVMIPTGLMYDPNLSRNARSSRAVPVETMIDEIMNNPVIPIHWGAAQKGMQAYAENHAEVDIRRVLGVPHHIGATNTQAWLLGRDLMVELARGFHAAGYHKQVINRLLEPWMHIDTLVSATEWTNFLALRDHHAAEPHIQKLAQEVKLAMEVSTPRPLKPGEWHLPYVNDDERQTLPQDVQREISVARCARISYAPFDGDGSIGKERERFNLLVGSSPLHASPAEHQGTPDFLKGFRTGYENEDKHGNLKGWIQFRKLLPNENITEIAA
jgi:hypothetical protein